MEELEHAIKNALLAAFPGMQVQFDPYPGYGKLHGTLIWEGFQGRLQLDRQHQVWDVLQPKLTDDQRYATGFLVMATPAEAYAMQEAAA